MVCSWHRDRFAGPWPVWQDRSTLARCCDSFLFCYSSMSSLRSKSPMLTCCSTFCTNSAFSWSGGSEGTSCGYCSGGNYSLDRDHCRIECVDFPMYVLVLVICSHHWWESSCHSSNFLHLGRSCQSERIHWRCCCCFAYVDYSDSSCSSGTCFPVEVVSNSDQNVQRHYYRLRLLMVKLDQICGLEPHLSCYRKDWLSECCRDDSLRRHRGGSSRELSATRQPSFASFRGMPAVQDRTDWASTAIAIIAAS